MSEQEIFPVGARVRERYARFTPHEGTVALLGSGGNEGRVYVRLDNGAELWYLCSNLEAVPPSHRAPARTLAPGIEQSEDTCDGKPRLAGMRLPTDSVRGWPDWEAFREAHPYLVREQEANYYHALCFEAGVAWGRERRRRRKEKRAVKRYERVRALAEAKGANE